MSIRIFSPNPADISPEEAEVLGRSIRELELDVEVEVSDQQRQGVAVTWAEILNISVTVLKSEGDKVASAIAGAAIKWAVDRFKERRNSSKRPVYINIYGPNGKILKAVAVKKGSDNAEDKTEEYRKVFEKPKQT